MSTDKKICPYCGEEIMADAKKCRHCGEWLIDTEDSNQSSIKEVSPKPSQIEAPHDRPNSTKLSPEKSRSNTLVYIIIAVIAIVLVAVVVFSASDNKNNSRSNDYYEAPVEELPAVEELPVEEEYEYDAPPPEQSVYNVEQN